MVDNTVTQITPAPVAPLVVDPVAVQAAPTIVTEAPTPASVVEATTTSEVTPKVSETLLGAPETKSDTIPPPVVPPVVEQKVEEVKQVEKSTTEIKEGSQSAEPAPPPTYEVFKMPEGVSLVPETLGKFTELLSTLETEGKADHALVQQFGQKAVDFYITEVQKSATDIHKNLQTAWDQQKVEWKESFLKDPEIGGERSQTTVDSALKFIRTHGGTAEQQQEFKSLMETSGLGNHPAMIRLLARASEGMSEGKPLTAVRPANTSVKSKVQTMYGKLAGT